MAKHAIKFEDRAELEKEDDFLTAFLYFSLPPSAARPAGKQKISPSQTPGGGTGKRGKEKAESLGRTFSTTLAYGVARN